jgi:hypothetical protein
MILADLELEMRYPYRIPLLTINVTRNRELLSIMGLHDPCVCVYSTELFMLNTHESHYVSEILDLAMLDMDNPNLKQLTYCLISILHA